MRPIGFAQGRECRQRPSRPPEPTVDLGRVEEQAAVVRGNRQAVVEVGQRRCVAPPCQRHLTLEMPRIGRLGRSPQACRGKAIGIVEETELHCHPATGEAQRYVVRGEAERLVDLFHRFHLLPPLPEHRGVVTAGVDVGRTPLHRLAEERLGAGEVLLIGGGEALVRKPARFGELLLGHRAVAIDEPTSRPRDNDAEQEGDPDGDRTTAGAGPGGFRSGGVTAARARPGRGGLPPANGRWRFEAAELFAELLGGHPDAQLAPAAEKEPADDGHRHGGGDRRPEQCDPRRDHPRSKADGCRQRSPDRDGVGGRGNDAGQPVTGARSHPPGDEEPAGSPCGGAKCA